tara:strand:- start:2248 stop:2958 length:711 start_codon:yes stop_codon:yes gene_type:complete
MNQIKEINISDSDTFKDPFLTFDIDWAHDEVIHDCYSLVKKYNVKTTWMVTHDSEVLSEIKSDQNCEIGIHPNFNKLLYGDYSNGKCPEEVIDRLLDIVPSCQIVRSHSLLQSSRIMNIFRSRNLKYDSNDYIPAAQISRVDPWEMENGLIKVPYIFSDELDCFKAGSPLTEILSRDGLKVFNFHPIHVFLNTENLKRYENTRGFHGMPKNLIKERYKGYGTRSKLVEILKELSNL